jgi:hypothetical protein
LLSYPTDNCFAQFGFGVPVNPQDEFSFYLNHTAGKAIIAPYLNSSNIAQAAGKPLLMLETNTASCGGFPGKDVLELFSMTAFICELGISDSFGSTLWALDYGFQLAYSNFSGGMLHIGGQDVYYNVYTMLFVGFCGTDDEIELF